MLKQEQLQREYELLKYQMLLNGRLQIPCIGIGKNSLAHFELACSRRSGQWREMENRGRETWKRVRGGKEVLSPSLPNPVPSPIFLAYFSFRFPNYLKACYMLTMCIPSFPTFYGIYSTWASSTLGALLLISRNGLVVLTFQLLLDCETFIFFLSGLR